MRLSFRRLLRHSSHRGLKGLRGSPVERMRASVAASCDGLGCAVESLWFGLAPFRTRRTGFGTLCSSLIGSVRDAAAPRASIGDQALILGFPQLHRGVSGENRINTRVLPIVDHVTDVADRRFTIADEKNGREILINPHSLSFPDHVGGMSGAPVFRISEASSAILIGISSEAGDGLHGAYFCSHAKYLLPDGTLDVKGLPPRL